jgi:predicted secreted protein
MAYNTTPAHGKLCRIEKDDEAMDYTDGWTINSTLDLADISRQGQSWKENIPGQAGWDGSFSGSFVAGNTEQKAIFDNIVAATPGTKLTDVKFLLDASTNAFTGNIYITGITVNGQLGDKISFSCNFTGDGALSLASDA